MNFPIEGGLKNSFFEKVQIMITFNTNRKYSSLGQRIAAIEDVDGIFFVDVDRGIKGLISTPCKFEQNAIMAAYDAGCYDYHLPVGGHVTLAKMTEFAKQ